MLYHVAPCCTRCSVRCDKTTLRSILAGSRAGAAAHATVGRGQRTRTKQRRHPVQGRRSWDVIRGHETWISTDQSHQRERESFWVVAFAGLWDPKRFDDWIVFWKSYYCQPYLPPCQMIRSSQPGILDDFCLLASHFGVQPWFGRPASERKPSELACFIWANCWVDKNLQKLIWN